ncbi:MAG: leucine--tRNA ligase [Herbinix sp.]|nr:leucine--tRNA ligase [Herbinix sp.]
MKILESLPPELIEYRELASKKSDFERTELVKEKTGVQISGLSAINPVNQKNIPIWISDYVLMTYGTGAIMAVPAHDERDWDFAKKFNLPIIEVVAGGNVPIVHCKSCGYVPIPESELPLMLPEVESYEPTDNGESPLAAMSDWVETRCPICGGEAHRETDTMPQWAGSSWYFLRYIDPHNNKAFASKEELDYWLPVDWYNGGMEHTTLHLLYSRFWHKFLYDQGLVSTPEPYKKRTSHGMILGENNEKMSKSRGNVVNPDDIINEFGADTLRTYEMFIGAFDLSAAWSNEGVKGCRRFLDRVWKLKDMLTQEDGFSAGLETKMHQTLKKVTLDFESMKFNTAIAAMMSLVNDFYKAGSVTKGEFKALILMLNPVAPHMTEELWQYIGEQGRVYQQTWPAYDEQKTIEDTVEIAVQINGKVKANLSISLEEKQPEVEAKALEIPAIKALLADKTIVKIIYVPGRIFNIVVK